MPGTSVLVWMVVRLGHEGAVLPCKSPPPLQNAGTQQRLGEGQPLPPAWSTSQTGQVPCVEVDHIMAPCLAPELDFETPP